jgi:hypothetical protein
MIVESLSSSDLLVNTQKLVASCAGLEAELLLHLGEIDHRKLYLDCGCSSLFVFCVKRYGFSEDITCSRTAVARAARQFPAILDSIRSGEVHLTGMRLLILHLTPENHREVLARAAGKSKRDIEELVASLSPQAPVPTVVRKLPERCAPAPEPQQPLVLTPAPNDTPPREIDVPASPTTIARPPRRPVMAPLSQETYKIQFTASRAFRDKLRQAQDLLRHRVPDGDPAAILEDALDLLIEKVKKERFAIGRKPRETTMARTVVASGRDVPDPMKREVAERDEERCAYVDPTTGYRCEETGGLEFDHIDGFARVPEHRPDRIRLLCRAHNQHVAEKMYGREFMEQKRTSKRGIRPGTDPQEPLFPPGAAEENPTRRHKS